MLECQLWRPPPKAGAPVNGSGPHGPRSWRGSQRLSQENSPHFRACKAGLPVLKKLQRGLAEQGMPSRRQDDKENQEAKESWGQQ